VQGGDGVLAQRDAGAVTGDGDDLVEGDRPDADGDLGRDVVGHGLDSTTSAAAARGTKARSCLGYETMTA
jgi:hypothetical protein